MSPQREGTLAGVLRADEDAILADWLKAQAARATRRLDAIGHDVTVCNDGRAALEVARRIQPEVILLDIGLPGVDGYEVARRLRGAPETSNVRIIAVSGYGQQKDRALSKDAGFDLHLVKPVDPERLAVAIAEAELA